MASNVCSVCGTKVKRTDKGVVCDGPCERWFHAACKNITDEHYKVLATNLKNEWFCERDDCAPAPNLQTFERKFDQLLAKLSDMDKKHREFTELLQFFSDSYDEMKKEFEKMKKLKDDLNVLTNSGPCAHTEDVAREMEENRQYSMLNNLKISGIPERQNEDVHQVMAGLANAAGVSLESGDLDAVHRTPTHNGNSHRPNGVKFVCRWKKDLILRNLREQKKRLTTTDAGFPGELTPVYFNEHLTPQREGLARRARELRKAVRIKYTWVRGCRIFVKEKEESPPVRISSMRDLERWN